MIKNKIYTALIITFFLFSYLSCHDKDSSPKTIGPEGGRVITSDGRFTLDIPPGALEEEVEISLELMDSNENTKSIFQENGDDEFNGSFLIYDAQPEGLEFLVPAVLSGDVTDISNNDEKNKDVMLGFNVTDESTEELGEQTYEFDMSNGNATYSAEVTHFSSLLLLNGTIIIEHSTVPSKNPAMSFLVDFNIKVSETGSGFTSIEDDEEESDAVEYFDHSKSMVIYKGQKTPFFLPQTEIAVMSSEINVFETTQPYDCGSKGNGIFNILIIIQGVQNNYPVPIANLILGKPSRFTIRVPGIQNVLCEDTVLVVGDDDDNLGGDDDNDVDEPIGDPNGDGGDDAIDGGGTAGEPDFGCSATDCTPIIGNTSSSGIVSSDPFNENLFVTNLCNSISIVDDNMANDVIINNGANIPVWAMTTFNPTDCSCRAFGSGTGSAAGFNNVLVEMDLFFDLLDGTFEGEASYNGSTGSQFPAVGYDCEGTFFSDKRLKNNLNLVHTFENGINLYSFNYNDNNEQMYIGVMAQDLNNMGLEHSVVTMPNGYYAVDYNKLGLRMTTLEEWEEKGLDSVVIDNNY